MCERACLRCECVRAFPVFLEGCMGMAVYCMPIINSRSCKHRQWAFGDRLITELSEVTMLEEKQQLKPHREE